MSLLWTNWPSWCADTVWRWSQDTRRLAQDIESTAMTPSASGLAGWMSTELASKRRDRNRLTQHCPAWVHFSRLNLVNKDLSNLDTITRPCPETTRPRPESTKAQKSSKKKRTSRKRRMSSTVIKAKPSHNILVDYSNGIMYGRRRKHSQRGSQRMWR